MTYQDLCRAGDVLGVLELLTNDAVEEKVLQRAFAKASMYGRDIDDCDFPNSNSTSESFDEATAGAGADSRTTSPNFKVDPHKIMAIYRDLVIPLTKDVEILYLFQRTGYPCPSLQGIHARRRLSRDVGDAKL